MDDLISRAAAIEAFDDERVDRNYGDVSPESVIKVIESIPAVDAVPVVHGEWKWSHGGECSECGFHNSNFDYRYCPMCGAKIDGERRDSE